MNRKEFLEKLAAASALLFSVHRVSAAKKPIAVRLLRHATLFVEVNEVSFLVDPMLSAREAMSPVQNAGNEFRIPMTDLPVSDQELSRLIRDVDAVMVTHTHRDHWDSMAHVMIPKDKPLFCQPADLDKLREQGFSAVTAVGDDTLFRGVSISRAGGQHGTGEMGRLMGTVSGFIIKGGGRQLYIIGDSIWCDEVAAAVKAHKPDVIVANAGAAKFLQSDPITMDTSDISMLMEATRKTSIVAVHMDTVNHCGLRRTDLKSFSAGKRWADRLFIPADGERLVF